MSKPLKETDQYKTQDVARANLLGQYHLSCPKIDSSLIEAREIVKRLSTTALTQAELYDMATDASQRTIVTVVNLIDRTLKDQKAARSKTTYQNLFELKNFIRSEEAVTKIANLLAGELYRIISNGNYLFNQIDRETEPCEKFEEATNKILKIFSSKYSHIHNEFNKIIAEEIANNSKSLNTFFDNILNFSDKVKNRCKLSYKNMLHSIFVWSEDAGNQRCSGRVLINLVHYHYDRNEDNLAVLNLKHAIEVMNLLDQTDRKLLMYELDNLLYNQSSNINFQKFYEILQSLWSEFGCDQEVLESKLSFINTLLEAHEDLNQDNNWDLITNNVDVASKLCDDILKAIVQERQLKEDNQKNIEIYQIRAERVRLRVDAFYLPTYLDGSLPSKRIFDKYSALEDIMLNSEDIVWQTELYELRESFRDFLFLISCKNYFSYEMRKKLDKLYVQVGRCENEAFDQNIE